MCSVARAQTHRQTNRQTDTNVNTVDTYPGTKIRGDAIPGAVFSHIMSKMDFDSHHFS